MGPLNINSTFTLISGLLLNLDYMLKGLVHSNYKKKVYSHLLLMVYSCRYLFFSEGFEFSAATPIQWRFHLWCSQH